MSIHEHNLTNKNNTPETPKNQTNPNAEITAKTNPEPTHRAPGKETSAKIRILRQRRIRNDTTLQEHYIRTWQPQRPNLASRKTPRAGQTSQKSTHRDTPKTV